MLILLLIYVASVIGSRWTTKKLYEKRWANSKPGAGDVFMVLMPVFNTVAFFVDLSYLKDYRPKKEKAKKEKKIRNYSKFFGLDRE